MTPQKFSGKEDRTRHLMLGVTEERYVLSHRVGVAKAARDAGWAVTFVTRVDNHGQRIRALGFECINFDFVLRKSSPWNILRRTLGLYGIYRRYRPDLVHHVSLQPVLLGSIAALLARTPAVINGITGMGFALTQNSLRARAIRYTLLPILSWVLRRDRTYTMVQNSQDAEFVSSLGVKLERLIYRQDTGVDIKRFMVAPEPPGPIRVTMASRLIWDKGVRVFVEAAVRIRAARDDILFTLVGEPDRKNPMSVPAERITEWVAAGFIEWWGYQEDMNSVWNRSHIATLPSYYREGLPMVLLEAAACGRPIVTTDIPGCRDVVQHGRNGYLVPPHDVEALASAIVALADNPPLRASMSSAGRRRMEAEFNHEQIGEKMLQCYEMVVTG